MILSTTLCCLLWGHSDIKPLVTTLSSRYGVPLVQVVPMLQAPQNLPASTEGHSQWSMLRGGEVHTWLLTGKPSSPIRPWGPLSPTAPWQTAGSEHHITSYIPLHHIILYIPLHHVTRSQTVLPLKPLLLYYYTTLILCYVTHWLYHIVSHYIVIWCHSEHSPGVLPNHRDR